MPSRCSRRFFSFFFFLLFQSVHGVSGSHLIYQNCIDDDDDERWDRIVHYFIPYTGLPRVVVDIFCFCLWFRPPPLSLYIPRHSCTPISLLYQARHGRCKAADGLPDMMASKEQSNLILHR